MALTSQQAIIWTNVDPVHWHIYVSLSLNKLNKLGSGKAPMGLRTESLLFQLMACHEFSTKPLPAQNDADLFSIGPLGINFSKKE